MAQVPLTASSSTLGFFQASPVLPPQYTFSKLLSKQALEKLQHGHNPADDQIMARIMSLYLPTDAEQVFEHVHHLARRSIDPAVLVHSTDAETNHPVLRPLTTFGEENKTDPLWTTAGWQKLKEIGFEEGVVAVAYDTSNVNFNRRIYEFALGHVWGPTGTMTGCPMSMTDGAATLLGRHLSDGDGDQPGRSQVFKEAYRRLTSRDPTEAWTSGQWMTERSGGSDVSGTETTAHRLTQTELDTESQGEKNVDAVGMPLGPWKIDGFKWFSSATDSEMAVLLARTSKGGLSAFYIPMRRRIMRSAHIDKDFAEIAGPQSELNGIRIQRLKNKLGTKSLPTAELELKGARGWLIGQEGQGVKDISAILNITRLSTAAGSVGNWSRGLAICRAYSKVRKVRGGLLKDNPAHLRWMADETVKYCAASHFVFLGVALQGALEQDWDKMVGNTKAAVLVPQDKTRIGALLRLITPVMKAQVSVASVDGLRNCQECLGGVGYCENNEEGGLMNIAKIYRDNLVNPIWEGTVSVMAEDLIRVINDRRLGDGNILKNVFAPWIRDILRKSSKAFDLEVTIAYKRLEALLNLVDGANREQLLYHGRELLNHIEIIVSGALVLHDASMQPSPVSEEIARRFVKSRSENVLLSRAQPQLNTEIDRAIFLGEGMPRQQSSSKL